MQSGHSNSCALSLENTPHSLPPVSTPPYADFMPLEPNISKFPEVSRFDIIFISYNKS